MVPQSGGLLSLLQFSGISKKVCHVDIVLYSSVVTNSHLLPFPLCADPQGGWGRNRGYRPSPLKKHKNLVFLSNTGLDTLNHKATKPAFNVGSSSARQRKVILIMMVHS